MINNCAQNKMGHDSYHTSMLSDGAFAQKILYLDRGYDPLSLLADNIVNISMKEPLQTINMHMILPTRRACRRLEDLITVRALEKEQTILMPKISAIGGLSFDDLGLLDNDDNKQVINSYERLLLLSMMILKRYPDYGVSHAMKFAKGMAGLIDDFIYNDLSYTDISSIISELDLNQYWRDILEFLEIAFSIIPSLMKDMNLTDKASQDMRLLGVLTDHISSGKTRFIILGISGENYFSRILQKAMYNSVHDNGLIILQGVNDYKYDAVPTSHLFKMQRLLCDLGVEHSSVDHESSQDSLINNIDNIDIVECPSMEDESMVISLMLKEAIAKNLDQSAILVTADFELANRVSLQLNSMGIDFDSSIGIPLAKSAIGAYVNLFASFMVDQESNEKLLALIKNPYFSFPFYAESLSESRKEQLKYVRAIESHLRRNGSRANLDKYDILVSFIKDMRLAYDSLISLSVGNDLSLSALTESLIILIKKYTNIDILRNRETESELFFSVIGDLEQSDFARSIMISKDNIKELPYIFNFILHQENIRNSYQNDSRVRILTPTEARLVVADRIIIGGMNDAPWINSVIGSGVSGDDFLLNTAIRKKLGLPISSEYIGELKNDFINLCHGSVEVFITRSTHKGGSINLKSRWLLEMESELKNKGEFESYKKKWLEKQSYYLSLKDMLQKNSRDKIAQKIKRPEPSPPLSARPRELYATHIEKLIDDPYEFYAKKILNLNYLPMLGENVDQLDKGIIFHKIMEKFVNGKDYSVRAFDRISDEVFNASSIQPNLQEFWRIRLRGIASWLVPEICSIFKAGVNSFYTETNGSYRLCNDIIIKANADRIDVSNDEINIIDYKTGTIPNIKQIKELQKPQLMIEALIAKNGGFKIPNYGDQNISIACWRINSSKKEINHYEKLDIEQLIKDTEVFLNDLSQYYLLDKSSTFIAEDKDNSAFDNPYKHLSRVKEWANL